MNERQLGNPDDYTHPLGVHIDSAPISYNEAATSDSVQLLKTARGDTSDLYDLLYDMYVSVPHTNTRGANGRLGCTTDIQPIVTPEQLARFIVDVFPESLTDRPTFLTSEILLEAVRMGVANETRIRNVALSHSIDRFAMHTLSDMIARTDAELAHVHADIEPYVHPDTKAVAIAWRLGEGAHMHEVRDSGRPYYDHSIEVAAIVLHALNQAKAHGNPIPNALVQAAVGIALTHDTPESTMIVSKRFERKADHYKDTAITPFAISRAFAKYSNGPNLQAEIALALRLLTHDKRTDWMPNYSSLIDRGMFDLFFALVKPADSYHNLVIEPKIITDYQSPQASKIREKQALYAGTITKAKKTLRTIAVYDTLDFTEPSKWGDDYIEAMRAISQPTMPQLRRNLEQYVWATTPPALQRGE